MTTKKTIVKTTAIKYGKQKQKKLEEIEFRSKIICFNELHEWIF